jgi:hypothetical protein
MASDSVVDALFGQIREWPINERLILASRILESVRSEGRQPSVTLGDLRGLMAGERVPPSDADVNRWLDDERSRKFG